MVTGPLFVVCSTLLTRAFLNVRHFSKLLDNLLLGNMFADLGVVVIMTIFFRQISFQYHNYLIFLHCLIALDVCRILLLQKLQTSTVLPCRVVYAACGCRHFYNQQRRFYARAS